MDIASLLQQSGMGGGPPQLGGGMGGPTGGAVGQPGLLEMLMKQFGGGPSTGGAPPSGEPMGLPPGQGGPPPGPIAPMGGPGSPPPPMGAGAGGGIGGIAGNTAGGGPSPMMKGMGQMGSAMGKGLMAQGAPKPMSAPPGGAISPFQAPKYTPPGQVSAGPPPNPFGPIR